MPRLSIPRPPTVPRPGTFDSPGPFNQPEPVVPLFGQRPPGATTPDPIGPVLPPDGPTTGTQPSTPQVENPNGPKPQTGPDGRTERPELPDPSNLLPDSGDTTTVRLGQPTPSRYLGTGNRTATATPTTTPTLRSGGSSVTTPIPRFPATTPSNMVVNGSTGNGVSRLLLAIQGLVVVTCCFTLAF